MKNSSTPMIPVRVTDSREAAATVTLRLPTEVEVEFGGAVLVATLPGKISNRLGLAKTLLLRARILTAPTETERSLNRLLDLRKQEPLLQTCPLFKKIMARWDDWISGQQLLGQTDEFWGM
jgi:hypothetical protein